MTGSTGSCLSERAFSDAPSLGTSRTCTSLPQEKLPYRFYSRSERAGPLQQHQEVRIIFILVLQTGKLRLGEARFIVEDLRERSPLNDLVLPQPSLYFSLNTMPSSPT